MPESRTGFALPACRGALHPTTPCLAFPEAPESPAGEMSPRLTSHFLCRLCSNIANYLPCSTSFFSVCLSPSQLLREMDHRALPTQPSTGPCCRNTLSLQPWGWSFGELWLLARRGAGIRGTGPGSCGRRLGPWFPGCALGVSAAHTSQVCPGLPGGTGTKAARLLPSSCRYCDTNVGPSSRCAEEDERGPRRPFPTETPLASCPWGVLCPGPPFSLQWSMGPLRWVASGSWLCAWHFSRSLACFFPPCLSAPTLMSFTILEDCGLAVEKASWSGRFRWCLCSLQLCDSKQGSSPLWALSACLQWFIRQFSAQRF